MKSALMRNLSVVPSMRDVPFDVDALLKRVEIRNPPFPIRLSWEPQGDYWLVQIRWTVPNRDRPEELIHVGNYVTVTKDHTPARVLLEVEDRIRGAFIHEFQECFHLDGVRIRDPHPPNRLTTEWRFTYKPEGV